MHIAVACSVRDAPRVAEALTALGWGTQWIDEPLLQSTNDDGYVLEAPPSDARAVVHAWPTREGESLVPPRCVLGHDVQAVQDDAAVDWNTAWRASFPTRVEIVPGIVLAPPWGERRDGERTVVIEPSAAFGTGLHPTTRASLRALWHALRPGDAVLDLGTGSGVLAIAAASWGAGSVTALDIDPTCATSIAANLALNALAPERVRFVTADATRWEEAGSAWHIVLANLAATDLSRGLSRWSARLTAGGALVGSGIWHASAGRLRSLAETERLTLVSDEHDEGWHTLVWRK